MVLTSDQRAAAAQALAGAERARAPIPPLVQSYPGTDVVDAYEIQLMNIRARVAAGAEIVGHKVGLSSAAMQQMMGVDEPDYGHLLADMQRFEGAVSDAQQYCAPRFEPEVGFILGADLPGEGCTEEDVLAATEAVTPALELIDSRIANWQIGLVDTICRQRVLGGFCARGRSGQAGRHRPAQHPGDAVAQRGEHGRGQFRCGAGQPGDRGGLAGPQGGRLRGTPAGGARHPARLLHPGHRHPAR